MKKYLLPMASLILCLILSACGGNDTIYGKVVDIQQHPESGTALILQTDGDKRIAVFLDDDTYVFGMDEIDGEAYKASPHTGVSLYFFPEGRKTTLTTADGETLNAYHADRYISIDAYLIQDAVTLSDGTPLDAWKTSMFGTTYQLKDGTELLREDAPSGPENHFVANLESFDDLSEAAKPAVRQYYEEQGALYDLPSELEKAWAEYQEDPESYGSYWIGQETAPSASRQKVLYFSTCLTMLVAQEPGSNSYVEVKSSSLPAAFDRNTGENIPLSDLFTCPASEIPKKLLDLAEKGGWPDTPALKQEMLKAFRMEYLSFRSDYVMLSFPAGTLPSQEYTCLVSVDYTAGLSDILQPWAIPQPRTE